MILDRSDWPAGPWDHEPDSKSWIDPATGYPCRIQRNSFGALCGYVSVSPDHPCITRGHDDLVVHGGITYDGIGQGCHQFGFDCAHAFDLAPGLTFQQRGTYHTMDFVVSECTSLAKQLKERE